MIGSKGALVLLIMVIGALLLSRRLPAPKVFACYVLLLRVYAVGGIAMGILGQDYHVIGFIGGLNGFLQNPLGHGIGVGGNLSLNMTAIDWGRSQTLGSTDIAVESAVGVLLFQIGIFGVVFIAVLTWIAIRTVEDVRRHARTCACSRGTRPAHHHRQRHFPGGSACSLRSRSA